VEMVFLVCSQITIHRTQTGETQQEVCICIFFFLPRLTKNWKRTYPRIQLLQYLNRFEDAISHGTIRFEVFCRWTCSSGKETLGVVVGPFLLFFCLSTRVTLNPKPMLTWAVQGNKDEHRLTMIKNDEACSLNYLAHSFTKPIAK